MKDKPHAPAAYEPKLVGHQAGSFSQLAPKSLLQLIQIEKTEIQAVILVPTRELGHQIHTNLEQFSKNIEGISIAATCGGIPIKPQIERLKTPTHIVVATPGRLIDLIQRKAIDLKQRLSSYNKISEPIVIYYKSFKTEKQMDVAENMVLEKLNQYKEQANLDRFVLPFDESIQLFIKPVNESYDYFN